MDDAKILEKLGGTVAVAALCELDKSAVSKWRRFGIPRAWRMVLLAQVTRGKLKANGGRNR